MIAVYLIIVFSIVSGELIVSSPEEVSRERLEREATLLDSVERETECETVTEREDTYEVIIDTDGERRPDKYVIGGWTCQYDGTDHICNRNQTTQFRELRTPLHLRSRHMRMTPSLLLSEDTSTALTKKIPS